MSENELQKLWDNEVVLPYKEKVDKLQDYFLSIYNNEIEKPDFIEKLVMKLRWSISLIRVSKCFGRRVMYL